MGAAVGNATDLYKLLSALYDKVIFEQTEVNRLAVTPQQAVEAARHMGRVEAYTIALELLRFTLRKAEKHGDQQQD